MKELRPGTSKIGFLVKNYPYGLIPRSKLANPGQHTSTLILIILYNNFEFKNSGLTLEFRFLVGIGRSGVMIGRFCLNIVFYLLHDAEL